MSVRRLYRQRKRAIRWFNGCYSSLFPSVYLGTAALSRPFVFIWLWSNVNRKFLNVRNKQVHVHAIATTLNSFSARGFSSVTVFAFIARFLDVCTHKVFHTFFCAGLFLSLQREKSRIRGNHLVPRSHLIIFSDFLSYKRVNAKFLERPDGLGFDV